MQANITTFNFKTNTVRTIPDEKGELWFLANDICDILGYSNPRRTVSLHCKERGVTKRYTPTQSAEQEMVYINEPNLYRLIIKSRKPEAEAFETWVMEEVLPQIRKTGQYQVAQLTLAKNNVSKYTSLALKTNSAGFDDLNFQRQIMPQKYNCGFFICMITLWGELGGAASVAPFRWNGSSTRLVSPHPFDDGR